MKGILCARSHTLKQHRDQALSPLQLRAYLERIGIEDGLPPTLQTLSDMHRAQHFTLPFENFDVHLPAAYSFEADHLFDKMVSRRRGGFCYELNLLLAYAFRAAGFSVDVLSGQLRHKDFFGEPFDHMTMRVRADDGEVLADVGNAETLQRPIPFDGTWSEQERGGAYRVTEHLGSPAVEYRGAPEGKVDVRYLFDPTPRDPSEFNEMLEFHTKSPESQFAKGWLCTLPRGRDGRITVSRGMLMETRAGKMERRALKSEEDLMSVLERNFGMNRFPIPSSWFRRQS